VASPPIVQQGVLVLALSDGKNSEMEETGDSIGVALHQVKA
jgi:hypothetical protein